MAASTTADLTLLGRKLGALDYNPDLYVKEVARRSVGGHELLQQRTNIKTLSESTHSLLKKNVYQNYRQFIDTAKEISFLESEMYQLSHMITDQRNLLSELMVVHIGDPSEVKDDMSMLDDTLETPAKPPEGDGKAKRTTFEKGRSLLEELLAKVEGCSLIREVPFRYMLHHSDLVEMDVAENTALHRVHGYLMNDGFMVATWLPNRRGTVRYKFSCFYELDSLAVVNVRDLGGVKHAFKLLVTPEVRLFQCADSTSKETWMEAFHKAKTDDMTEETAQAPNDSYNPFEEDAGSGKDNANGDREAADAEGCDVDRTNDDEFKLPEWLVEFSDDVEVLMAQREFSPAVVLVLNAVEFCNDDNHRAEPCVKQLAEMLDERTRSLIEMLAAELSTEKSFQGGPKAARSAVQLLCKMGRSTQATDLFLKHRAAILSNSLRSGKNENATANYVRRQSATFFQNVMESTAEFQKALTTKGQLSSLLVWIQEQMVQFVGRIENHIFSPSTPLDVISSCVESMRQQCGRLSAEAGLDLMFLLDAQLRRNVERTICEHRDKHVDAVKLRAQEDKWEPINCFNKAGTERFLEEMTSAGIPSVRAHVYDTCWVSLTRNTTSFSISYLNLADSLLRLFNLSTRALVNESLVTVFHAHLRHMEQAFRSERLRKVDPKFIQRNAAFLLDTLLSLVETRYQEKTGTDCPKLGKLHSSYSWLKDATSSKYSDPNYV